MMTLSNEKVNTLKEIFWAMNEVTFTKDVESYQETIIHLTWTEHKTVTHTKLHINIKVALEQVGNVGGQPFWSWYGFGSRVEWCACFVSTEILYFSIGKVMALQITLE